MSTPGKPANQSNTGEIHRETFAAQAGGPIDRETGAITPPIHLTTTYERDGDLDYPKGFIYGRPDNPTIRQAEAVITRLEAGHDTLLFPSGMAAATTAILALDPPAHIVAPRVMYWSLRNWLATAAPRFGIETTFVDTTNLDAIRAACQPGKTRLIWLETPANPLWNITDIEAAAKIAHDVGAVLAVDLTCASPALTQPLTHGADIVMHSATKYLNGHSDVLAGSLTFKENNPALAMMERAASHRATSAPSWALSRQPCSCAACAHFSSASAINRQPPSRLPAPWRPIRRSPKSSIQASRITRATSSPNARCPADLAACCQSVSQPAKQPLSAPLPRSRSGNARHHSAASKASWSTAPASKAPTAPVRPIFYVFQSASKTPPT